MDNILLTRNDLPAANAGLLLEELEAALGQEVALQVKQQGGQLIDAQIALSSGQPLTPAQIDAIFQVAALHDAGGLSSVEAAAQAESMRQADARGRLTLVGADGVRQVGLPELADVVADIVEALNLDVNDE